MEGESGYRRALAQFDLPGFIRRHGGYKESKFSREAEYLMTCPLCGSSRLRCNVEKHTWICWSCKRTGDTLRLVELCEKKTTHEAFEIILRSYIGGDANLGPLAHAAPRTQRNPLRKLPSIPWPDAVDVIDPAHPLFADAVAYLARRGIGPAEIIRYRLGYGRVGKLAKRIVFPCWMNGVLVYWQARATWDPPAHLRGEELRAWLAETGYRKTLNPTSSDDEAATAGEALFNLDGVAGSESVVIVEGPVDAIKVGPWAVALLGKGRSASKVARLQRIRGVARYYVYLDRDAAQEAHALAGELAAFAPVLIATPPEGYDPGALAPEQNALILAAATPYRADRGLSGVLKK